MNYLRGNRYKEPERDHSNENREDTAKDLTGMAGEYGHVASPAMPSFATAHMAPFDPYALGRSNAFSGALALWLASV